ncbi:MAG TPA: universal stress protein [Solirubrobacteraceae bacterium]|jgi:nucleotide-binding universal stress UspA family protein|nr:universal stress protein [Solirubrobacteraceae bacterium]
MGDAIVVGTDGSDTAKRAVAEAARLAKALNADLHVVSAYEPLRGTRSGGGEQTGPLPDAIVDSTLAQAETAVRLTEVPVHTHAVRKDPTDALIDVASDVGATMIVVGNQGMHGAKRMLGSVPNSVSHKARCNVLIVATDTP